MSSVHPPSSLCPKSLYRRWQRGRRLPPLRHQLKTFFFLSPFASDSICLFRSSTAAAVATAVAAASGGEDITLLAQSYKYRESSAVHPPPPPRTSFPLDKANSISILYCCCSTTKKKEKRRRRRRRRRKCCCWFTWFFIVFLVSMLVQRGGRWHEVRDSDDLCCSVVVSSSFDTRRWAQLSAAQGGRDERERVHSQCRIFDQKKAKIPFFFVAVAPLLALWFLSVTRVHLHRPTDRWPLAVRCASMEKQKDLSKSMDCAVAAEGQTEKTNKLFSFPFVVVAVVGGRARERAECLQSKHAPKVYVFFFSFLFLFQLRPGRGNRRIENLSYCLVEWKWFIELCNNNNNSNSGTYLFFPSFIKSKTRKSQELTDWFPYWPPPTPPPPPPFTILRKS